MLELKGETMVLPYDENMKIAIKYNSYKNEFIPRLRSFYVASGADNCFEVITKDSYYAYVFLSIDQSSENSLFVFMSRIIPENVDCKLTVRGRLEFARVNGEIVIEDKMLKKSWYW